MVGSFAHDALSDIDASDVERMLDLDESLFVEHKRDIGRDSSFKLVQAVAAFANTLGGWVLIGVENGAPHNRSSEWGDPDRGPTLVDRVRDRLRGELDPLPAFEAKVVRLSEGSVGVIRVYESADTPHVALRNGSVFVREAAGVSDASNPGKPGSDTSSRRRYVAAQIRSRAQLVELASRGRLAQERVSELLDPARPLPLITSGLGLAEGFELGRNAAPPAGGTVFVRLVPYTLPPRFQGWTTTADSASAVLSAAERLADRIGLTNSWIDPHPAGASVTVPMEVGSLHRDAAGGGLDAMTRVVVDGAGVVGTALSLASPENGDRRAWWTVDQLAQQLIAPTLRAACRILEGGEFLGRTRCHIDLVGMGKVLVIEGGSGSHELPWVPTTVDLSIPSDDFQISETARRASYAYGRGAGVHVWDAKAGN